MRKEIWFGLSIMAAVVIAVFALMPAPSQMTNGHLGLLMLALVVVAIMLGFPTAFTLMGMGVLFAWFAYRAQNPDLAVAQTLDLMVQRAYAVMSNDVLISIPLFVFMGYLVERSNLIEKLFRSLHLALARIPGSLAVATLITCAVFATATGIVGAVVTLMGLLALPAMLRAGYNIKISAGVITAGGCLGILIPPSVMLIVYGATAGVSVVKLYAGAFFPGLMLAGLYILYVIILAKLRPDMMPPLPAAERTVPVPSHLLAVDPTGRRNVVAALWGSLTGRSPRATARGVLRRELAVALLPALVFALLMGLTWNALTKPDAVTDTSSLQQMGDLGNAPAETPDASGLQEPPAAADTGLAEPPEEGALQEPPAEGGLQEPPAAGGLQVPPGAAESPALPGHPRHPLCRRRPLRRLPPWNGIATPHRLRSGSCWPPACSALGAFYTLFNLPRFEIFKMLLASFFPLAVLILAVLGTIVFGLATPTEAAAVGSFGGFALAAVYAFVGDAGGQAARHRATSGFRSSP